MQKATDSCYSRALQNGTEEYCVCKAAFRILAVSKELLGRQVLESKEGSFRKLAGSLLPHIALSFALLSVKQLGKLVAGKSKDVSIL